MNGGATGAGGAAKPEDGVWTEIAPAEFTWERHALAAVREHLPDVLPLRAWTGFEFMALDGATFQVDLLIFTRAGIFLIKLVNLRGWADLGRWSWINVDEGQRREVFDNPVKDAELAADRLRALLSHFIKGAVCPPIDALVLLADPTLRIEGALPARVVFPHATPDRPDLTAALRDGLVPGAPTRALNLDQSAFGRFVQAIGEADPGPTSKYRVVGDFRLGKLLATSASHQDYLARHAANDTLARARVFIAERDNSDARTLRLRKAAEREFEVLKGLEHAGILRAERLVNLKDRPTIFFEHPEGAVRLDHLLASQEALTVEARFDLLRQIAEAALYAHRRRIVHRGLSPQSVLVVPEPHGLRTRIFNWQAASRADSLKTGTHHLLDYLEDASIVYAEPQSANDPEPDPRIDVFSLGAIALTLFTGLPPASSQIDLAQRLYQHEGLRASALADGVPPALERLIFGATRALRRTRIPSVEAFLDALEAARRETLEPPEPGFVDPMEARPGDLIDDRFEVVRRLGSGSSALALLVREGDGREAVLKIALSARDALRLDAEARTLRKLDDRLIVDLYDVVSLHDDALGQRRALLLQFAGETLLDRLRQEQRLSLDDLRRFGEDLCEILETLETHKTLHRDIKPANLGIGTPVGSTQRLMLFDFSLSEAPLDAVNVGTASYRDPFLPLRGRWDEHADRYAAALTLHEMATHRLPTWGRPNESPLHDPDALLHLEPERFPASARSDLEAFFRRGLARAVEARFDNAAHMLEAWRHVFQAALTTSHDKGQGPALDHVNPDTPLNTLGLSAAALDALDRLQMLTVGDLLLQPPQSIFFQRGTSGPVRNELRELRDRLSARFPALDSLTDLSGLSPDHGTLSVDHLVEHLLGDRSNLKADQRAVLARAFGLESPEAHPALPWPPRQDLEGSGEHANLFAWTCARWTRKKALEPLRDELVSLIERMGGAVADVELATGALSLRGSLETDPHRRLALASAASRAAVEAELASKEPRLTLSRLAGRAFIATRTALLDALPDLGVMADLLADEVPLLSPARVFDELCEVLQKAGLPPLPRSRLHALAALASSNAALSSRLELYPRGMDPLRTLKLSSGVLVSGGPLSDDEVRQRVDARYPQAQPLPTGPELGALLREAGLPLVWNAAHDGGRGAFISSHPPSLHRASSLSPFSDPNAAPDLLIDPFESKLDYKHRYGGFLALMADARYVEAVQRALAERFPDLTILSLDALWIDALRQRALSLGVDWTVILEADSPDADPEDRRHFNDLLRHQIHPAVQANLLARKGQRLLLLHPGLAARFADSGAMTIIENLRKRAGEADGPAAVWLLLPADEQRDAPVIDGVTLPVIDPSEALRAPRAWIRTLLQH